MKCKRCGADIIDGAKFCGVCGNPIEYNYDVCRYCGAKLPKGAVFCAECGKKQTEHNEVQEEPIRESKSENITDSQIETKEQQEAHVDLFEGIGDDSVSEEPPSEEDIVDVQFEKASPSENNFNYTPKQVNKSKPKKKTPAIIIGACVVVLVVIGGIVLAHNGQEDEYVSDSDTEYDTESYDENFGDEVDKQEEEFQDETESEVNLVISDSGYSIIKPEYSDEYEVSYGIEIKNKSSKKTEKRFITIKATARDNKGSVIDTDEEYFTIEVLPQKTTCVGRTVMYLEEKPDKVEFELSYESDPIFTEQVETVEVSEINMKEKDGMILVSGDLINDTDKNYPYGQVFIIYKGKNGIVGGTQLYVEPAKKGKNGFSEEIDLEAKLSDKYEVYAMASE